MKKWLKKILDSSRLEGVRNNLSLGPLPSDDFVFKLAVTAEELEAAYALLHDSYTKEGYMRPHPSGLRCTIFHAMPHAIVLVAKKQNRVVATVTLVKDGPMGLPSDHDYKNENLKYRRKGERLCEVSSLAIDPEFRSGQITFHLIKYLWHYATDLLDATVLCCVINPKALDFYQAYLNFKKSGPEINYEFVEGAKGVYIARELSGHKDWMKKTFSDRPLAQNLYRFFYDDSPSFIYPEKSQLCLIKPVLTKEMLRYFFSEKTDTFKNADKQQITLVESAYSLYFNFINEFLSKNETNPEEPTNRFHFRYPSAIPAALFNNELTILGKITDVGINGVFFQTEDVIDLKQNFQIVFKVENEIFILEVEPRWKTTNSKNSVSQGYGFRFVTYPDTLVQVLKRMHYNQQDSL